MDTGGNSLDTGGNSMGGSGSRFNGGTTVEKHLHWQRDISGAPGVARDTVTIEGPFADLKKMADGLKVGCKADEQLFVDSGAADDYATVATFRLSRVQGSGAKLSATFCRMSGLQSGTGGVSFWSIDMAAVSKPVETWPGPPGQDDPPDLAALAQWKAFRDKGDMEAYSAYKCGPGETLQGSTLTLAMMIREQGVSSYTLHYPVLTATKVFTLPSGTNVGAGLDKTFGSFDAMKSYIGGEPAGASPVGFFATLPQDRVWLMTGDRIVTNADGTYTRVCQWMGADSVDPNLYGEYNG